MARPRLLKGPDLVRIIYGFEINDFLDYELAALCLLRLELMIEDWKGAYQGGLNLSDPHPLFVKALELLSDSKWATNWSQKFPLRAADISASLEAFKARRAILAAEAAAALTRAPIPRD